jgi:hypothetical protein
MGKHIIAKTGNIGWCPSSVRLIRHLQIE